MSDFVARLFDEHDQLRLKVDKLSEFILSEKFDKLPEVDRDDLRSQLRHMKAYLKILNRRVSRQCG